ASSRSCSRDDPEGGARRGVLRRRLVTVRPGGSGPRPPGTTTWLRGARCNRSGANAGERSAAPGAQNRHGGAPRGERPASWDARRLARRLVRRVMACPPGASPSTRTFLGAPPTPRFGVSEGKSQTPDAENAPRERDGLFEIVSCELRDARPHPEERARRRRSANFERACARLEG